MAKTAKRMPDGLRKPRPSHKQQQEGKKARKVFYAAYNYLTKSYVKIANPTARKRNQMLIMGNYSLLKISGLP